MRNEFSSKQSVRPTDIVVGGNGPRVVVMRFQNRSYNYFSLPVAATPGFVQKKVGSRPVIVFAGDTQTAAVIGKLANKVGRKAESRNKKDLEGARRGGAWVAPS